MVERTLILVPTHAWRRTLRRALPPVAGVSIHTAQEWIQERILDATLDDLIAGGEELPPPADDALRRAIDFLASIATDPERLGRFAKPGWLDELLPILSDLGGCVPMLRGLSLDPLVDCVLPRSDTARLGPKGREAFRALAERFLSLRAAHDPRERAAQALGRVATRILTTQRITRALAVGFYDLDTTQALALGAIRAHVGTEHFSFVLPTRAEGRALLEEFRPALAAARGVHDLDNLVAEEDARADFLLTPGLALAARLDPTRRREEAGSGEPSRAKVATNLPRLAITGALHPEQEVLLALDRTRVLIEEEGVPPGEVLWITRDLAALGDALDAACPGPAVVRLPQRRRLVDTGIGRLIPALRRAVLEPEDVGSVLAILLHPAVSPPQGSRREIVRLLLTFRAHPFFQHSWRRHVTVSPDTSSDGIWRALLEGPVVDAAAAWDATEEGGPGGGSGDGEGGEPRGDEAAAEANLGAEGGGGDEGSRDGAARLRAARRLRKAAAFLRPLITLLDVLAAAPDMGTFVKAFEALHTGEDQEGRGWILAEAEATHRDPLRRAAGLSWRRLRERMQGAAHEHPTLPLPAVPARFDLLERAALAAPVEIAPARSSVRALDVLAARGERCRSVFILGLHEGGFPRRSSPPLLGRDEDRARAEDGVPETIEGFLTTPPRIPLFPKRREIEEQILFREALAAARESLFLSYARQDAAGVTRVPSPFLAEAAAAHAEPCLPPEDPLREPFLEAALSGRPDWITGLQASLTAWRETRPDFLPHLDIREVDWAEEAPPAEAPSTRHGTPDPDAPDPRMRARTGAMADPAARAAQVDEILRNHARPEGAESFTAHVWSPGALEEFLTCPMRHRLCRELGLEDRAPLTAFQGLDPLGRGTILHAVYQDWISSLDAVAPPESDGPWRQGLRRCLAARLHEARAVLGGASAFERFFLGRERWALMRDADAFASWEWRWRKRRAVEKTLCEVAFGEVDPACVRIEVRGEAAGAGEAPEVAPASPPGMTLRLRGRMDRIDLLADGTARIVEYKTGAAWPETWILGKLRLQAWLYERVLEAHREKLTATAPRGGNLAAAGVRGIYCFASRKGGFEVLAPSIPVRPLLHLLAAARDLFDAALAPPLPLDGQSCLHCPARTICLPSRLETLEAWAEDILARPAPAPATRGDARTRSPRAVAEAFLLARRGYTRGASP